MAARGGGGAMGRRGGREARTGLRGTRRRLSVVSDNKLVEGLATLGIQDQDRSVQRETKHVVKTYAGVSKKGYAPYNPRKKNQDSLLMAEDPSTGTLYLGVLDGHGEVGDLVSQFLADRLADRVFQNTSFRADPGRSLRDEVLSLERQLLADASIDTDFSGTTCVMGTIRDRRLTVANIGDSRVILGRVGAGGRYTAVPVSDDHKPDRPDEQRRIESRGGRVFAVEYDDGVDGPARVWLGHMDIPGLAMARSLGDVVAHTAGVISDPEMHYVDLHPDDKIMVWASDGLWEFMSNQEVIDMIVRTSLSDPKKVVDALVAEANKRWMREEQVIDDTTVIVCFLR